MPGGLRVLINRDVQEGSRQKFRGEIGWQTFFEDNAGEKSESADKPGSVLGSHSSGMLVAEHL